jgi:peptidoglycan/LPS O-acetylase OafA/YrhL
MTSSLSIATQSRELPLSQGSAPPLPEPAPTGPAARHVAALDGLRGVAVLMVMLHHAGAPLLGFGLAGVDIFFVLSGFLITSLIAKEYDRNGVVSLPKFWGRRFLRLMPAYWLFISSITILIFLSPRIMAGPKDWGIGEFVASLWLYFNNYAPRDGITHWQVLTGHLWSLCVEEQFYLVWPVICLMALRMRFGEVVAWMLLIAIFIRRQFVHSVPELMYRIDARGFGIILGCAVALALRGSLRNLPTYLRQRGVAAAVLIFTGLTLAFCSLGYDHIRGFFDPYSKWLLPVIAIEFVLITVMLWCGPATWWTRALSTKPLVYIGQISYGMYLYHPLTHYLTWKVWLANIEHWNKVPKYGLRLFVFLSLSLLFASASYHLYERFFLRLKERLR